MKKPYFGTDGIRGRVGVSPISPDEILKLGWAVGSVLNQARSARNKVLIGKDTRVSGYMFEAALEAGLSAAGVDVFLLGPMPTPAIAYLTRTLHAQAGIVISASHNGYEDNGIKFFSGQGCKVSDAMEAQIESYLNRPLQTVESRFLGKAQRITDAAGRYIEFCKSTFPNRLDLQALKIVLDCAEGATYHVAPSVFKELGAEVVSLFVDPDGFNINAQCGSLYPQVLAQAVLAHQADLGIAFDGDGDRVIMVDHTGAIMDGDALLYIIACLYQEAYGIVGVVGTVMSNLGLELALKRRNLEFVRTAVGDRHVLAQLQERGWPIGGEPSGHVLCCDLNSTGDGIIVALQVLRVMREQHCALCDLWGDFQKYPQLIINVRTPYAHQLMGMASIQAAIHAAEQALMGTGRVVLRPSGTEPVIRIMVEGEDAAEVERITYALAQVVETAVL